MRTRLSGLAAAIIVLVLSLTPEPVAFKSTASNEALALLATLLFVALLVERALEVFVNTWRSEGASNPVSQREAGFSFSRVSDSR